MLPKKERKVVQIAAMAKDCVMALCDDGSLWKLELVHRTDKDRWVWTPIKMSGPDETSNSE